MTSKPKPSLGVCPGFGLLTPLSATVSFFGPGGAPRNSSRKICDGPGIGMYNSTARNATAPERFVLGQA